MNYYCHIHAIKKDTNIIVGIFQWGSGISIVPERQKTGKENNVFAYYLQK